MSTRNPSPTAAPKQQDAPGAPELTPVHAQLLEALDRMLTTGCYYPPGHAQYQVVADQCAEAVAHALGKRTSVEIEISREGLVLGGVTVPRTDRRAARLHELVEPLNQALLEIHAGLTAADLHEGLSVLKRHRKDLSATSAYQEVIIEGMPATLTVTDRALYMRTRGGNGPVQTSSPLNAYFDPNAIPEAALVSSPDGQGLEREFLAVIRGLMQATNGVKVDDFRHAEDDEAVELLGTWVPDQAIATIQQVIKALEDTQTDPMLLPHLIQHAQEAMKLTGQPELVELVFERLRKTNLARPRKQRLLENRPTPSRKPTRFTLSRAELRRAIEEVHEAAAGITYASAYDMVTPARADTVGICLQVLQVAPTDELAAGIGAMLHAVLADPAVDDETLGVVSGALRSLFSTESAGTTELVVELTTMPLRQAHPGKLGPLWCRVWDGLDGATERERAWPFVVNDILLGMQWSDPAEKIDLLRRVSELETGGRQDLLVRLEALTALRDKTLAVHAFHAPAPLLYNVHKLLLTSSAAEEHGQLMHRRLLHQKAHKLASILMDGFAEYSAERRNLYEAVLDQGVQGPIVPALREVAVRHLRGMIERLDPDRRSAAWVPDAIGWLGQLGGDRAHGLLRKIVSEKKYLIVPVWPAACRSAARSALDSPHGRGGQAREEGGQRGQDDIQ